ncbi:adenine methylase [Serratia fonticola]|uniref:DNA adenine methylase n=1 Tax=Serratia fonticola TaxID=47917 RepID=UPI000BFDD973|nr:adenine methylase [Serratia fonticola]
MIRSPLKWAGSKAGIMAELVKHLPVAKRLVEPFAGSCSVMMNTDYPEYLVADINPDLINMYEAIRNCPAAFINHAALLFEKANSADEYYRRREEFRGNALSPWDRAVTFLYLNRHGYGGMCRYNKDGQYNVPYGKYKKPYFPKAEIMAFAEKSERATFVCADFRTTLAVVRPGDLIYCDPPYLPVSKTADFSSYHTGGFSASDHADLTAELLRLTVSPRVPVVISNSDTTAARTLYGRFHIESITAPRAVGNRTGGKATADELIASCAPCCDVNIGWYQPL